MLLKVLKHIINKNLLKKLDLFEFILLVIILKIVNSIYKNKIIIEYYLILESGILRNQFIEIFF